MAASPEKLIVFVKAPRPGAAKTRLAAAIGGEGALRAYRAMVETVLGTLAAMPAGATVELRFSPDDAAGDIRPWLKPGWRAVPQGTGDLGERMARAFGDAFATGVTRVLLVGSDCPELAASDIQEGWAALAECDAVLGPANDGGYWLIGLSAPQPALFAEIPWSTNTVLSATLTRASQTGLVVHLLRTLRDIDTAEDWERFQRTPACASPAPPVAGR